MQLKILPQGPGIYHDFCRPGSCTPTCYHPLQQQWSPPQTKTAHDLRSMPDPNDCPLIMWAALIALPALAHPADGRTDFSGV